MEHQTFRFAKMILRDRCSTSYDLASLFRGRRSTLDRWSTQSSIFEGSLPELLRFGYCQFENLRKSRRIASFSMLPTSKIEEISQTCHASDVVKFKNGGIVAE